MHENVRYHVCLTLTQVAFGLVKLYTSANDAEIDSDKKYKWEAGIPLKEQLPDQVNQFLISVLYPHFHELIMREQSKEVIEKVLECIRDIADEMGPAGVITNIEMIVRTLEDLLNKECHC